MLLLARTAPGLDLSYLDQDLDLAEDRRHQDDATDGCSLKRRFRCLGCNGADHGLMGEERSSFNPEESSQGWQLLIEGY